MAKAKKPVSGGKTAAETSKPSAAKSTSASKSAPKTDPGETKTPPPAATSKGSASSAASKTVTDLKKAEPVKAARTGAADAKATSKDLSKDAAPKDTSTKAKPAVSDAVKPPSQNTSGTPKVGNKSEVATDAAKAEPKPQAAPEKKPEPAPVMQQKPQERGSVFWPLVLGGVVAGVIGFVASEMDVLGIRKGADDLAQRLDQQQEQIAALQAVEPAGANAMEIPDLSGITAELETLSSNLTSLEERLSAVEARPVATVSGNSEENAVYSEELAGLQASVEAQKAEIQSLLDNAKSVEEATASMAQAAEMRAALTGISAALTSGAPFADALSDLEAGGITDIPAALSDTASSGVVTLVNLQSRFADNARAALSDARATGDQTGEEGIAGFLRRQLGARSVAPREGSDPDAILSRAEAAVRDGKISDALGELDALPENTRASLDDWLADARARTNAEAAVQDLSQRLTAN